MTVLSYTRFPLRLIPTPNHAPRGTLIADQRGRAQHDQGGKQEANGGKLAFIRAVQAFTCHGAGGQGHTQFYSIDFYVARSFLWYFLGLQESTVFLVPLVPLSPVLAVVPGNLLHFFMLGGQLRRAVGFRRQRLIALP